MRPARISNSPEDTLALGESLGRLLKGGEIILFNGDLGAGKTLMTKGIAHGLGLDDSTPVVSPTFTLVNVYKARLNLVHIDLYRLSHDEIYDLGLDDYLDQKHVLVVEWADIARDFFTGPAIEVKITHLGESTRMIELISDLPYISQFF